MNRQKKKQKTFKLIKEFFIWKRRYPGGSEDIEPEETQVQSMGQEAPLEKGMATHSSILTWRIPWTDEPGRLQSTGLQRVGHD